MTLPMASTGLHLNLEFVGAVLNVLDKHQARALNWGFFDLTISEVEIEDLLATELAEHYRVEWEELRQVDGYDAAVLASELAGANLLYADPTRHGRYRTRFAEGVRLIARLRQTFRAQQWATAPALISDLKVNVAERRFPVRGESAAVCWADLRRLCRHERLQQDIFDALAATPNTQPITFAAFQRRSFSRILERYGTTGLSGTVVSAGTGSGKTKAFYVPAFLGVVADIADDPRPYTKVIAVYPRNVLLADQLREALSEAAKVRPVLVEHGHRDITFGALLGDTPPDSDSFEGQNGPSYVEQFTEWVRRGTAWEVPFLRSPIRSEKPLVWRDEDRQRGRTALYRADGTVAAPDVPDGALRITRAQLQAEPPDVLFLSLEMLNQHMGNPSWARTFGLDERAPKPRLLLLDEVHTHEGIPGAQAAWILRRWRHWGSINDIHVVGLSATLKNASAHLATVAGIPAIQVMECYPRPGEFEEQDVDLEYNVVVKGNPAAGTSLLATSIQTAMLLPRLLTPRSLARSRGGLSAEMFFGRKVFGFTDKLDVVNRWLSDLRDAEVNRRLPVLRAIPDSMQTPPDTLRAKERDGQVWRLPVQLGHNLAQALTVSRCSSQDPGASADSDLIVATSSLEVGYDDPDVGATLHHKRPRSMASFIQRKGRAGRRRPMRPWTVVVLSDYGADRWAFQNAETLLNPEVGDINVPLCNAHVLRIQGAYFLIDWIGRRIRAGGPFDYLKPSRPGMEGRWRQTREHAAALLDELLDQGDAWRDFQHEFRACFRSPNGAGTRPLSNGELDALFWQSPRPLLTDAVPELLRKLERSWRLSDPAQPNAAREDGDMRRPMPRHIPSATFAELEVGETTLVFPPQPGKRPETLSVGRALAEVALGNVSKRYSVRASEPGYWHPFSVRLAGQNGLVSVTASVAELFPERLFVGVVGNVQVFEPQVVQVVPITGAIRDTSKGSWVWEVGVRPIGDGAPLPVLMTSGWRSVFADCLAYLHLDHSRLEVLRYAREGRYEIRDSRANLHVGRLALRPQMEEGVEQREEAVGFRKDVDGIMLRVVPEAIAVLPDLSPALLAQLRGEFFREGLRSSVVFSDEVSVFLRDWLWQMSLAMLTATAASNEESLQAAHERLGTARARAAEKVLDSIFQMRDVEVPHGDEEARLKTKLRELWREQGIVDEVLRLEVRLWEPLGSDFEQWARRRHVAALAQALRAAAVSRIQEVSEDDIAVDVLWMGDSASIVLSEVESGGIGIIERVAAELRSEPDAFHTSLRHHLAWCPRAELAQTIAGVVRASLGSDDISGVLGAAFQAARSADSYAEAAAAFDQLRHAVDLAGYAPTRHALVALVARLLQPGTSAALDSLVSDLDTRRSTLAHEIGLWPASESFAYHLLQLPDVRGALEAVLRAIGQHDPDEHQLFVAAQRLLVEGCHDSCPECLDQPNRYTDFGKPARNLTAVWLRTSPLLLRVSVGDQWRHTARRTLLEAGAVTIVASVDRMHDVVLFTQELLAEEVPSGYLLLPVTITRVQRDGKDWEITLELKESGNA